MRITNRIGKLKYWRRLTRPSELAAFALKYSRHKLRLPGVRPVLERTFMNRVKKRHRNFDSHRQIWHAIAIQTICGCNGSCWFCPSRSLKRNNEPMDIEVFKKIVSELELLEYCGAIVLDLQCDPFFDDRIEEFCFTTPILIHDLIDARCIRGVILQIQKQNSSPVLIVSWCLDLIVLDHGPIR